MVRERTGLGQPFPTLSELLRSLGELVEPVPSPIFVRMKSEPPPPPPPLPLAGVLLLVRVLSLPSVADDLPRQEAEAKSHGGGYSVRARAVSARARHSIDERTRADLRPRRTTGASWCWGIRGTWPNAHCALCAPTGGGLQALGVEQQQGSVNAYGVRRPLVAGACVWCTAPPVSGYDGC